MAPSIEWIHKENIQHDEKEIDEVEDGIGAPAEGFDSVGSFEDNNMEAVASKVNCKNCSFVAAKASESGSSSRFELEKYLPLFWVMIAVRLS